MLLGPTRVVLHCSDLIAQAKACLACLWSPGSQVLLAVGCCANQQDKQQQHASSRRNTAPCNACCLLSRTPDAPGSYCFSLIRTVGPSTRLVRSLRVLRSGHPALQKTRANACRCGTARRRTSTTSCSRRPKASGHTCCCTCPQAKY